MSSQFNVHRADAKSGETENMVVLLHGYGANGGDLLGLSEVWGPSMPNTLFVAPDAPSPCDSHPAGRQWFPIEAAGPVDRMDMIHNLIRSFNELNEFLDVENERAGVPEEKTILVGFSQGTMMALHVGLRRQRQLAGIVGYSGKLLNPSLLESELVTRPPVMLVHGQDDEVVPSSQSIEADEFLKRSGINSQLYLAPRLGHSIDMFGLGLALNFMKTHLDN